MISNHASYTCEIKSRTGMAKASFKKKKKNNNNNNNITLFNSKLDFDVRNKSEKCHIWSIVLYGTESWALREVEEKYMESF